MTIVFEGKIPSNVVLTYKDLYACKLAAIETMGSENLYDMETYIEGDFGYVKVTDSETKNITFLGRYRV